MLVWIGVYWLSLGLCEFALFVKKKKVMMPENYFTFFVCFYVVVLLYGIIWYPCIITDPVLNYAAIGKNT